MKNIKTIWNYYSNIYDNCYYNGSIIIIILVIFNIIPAYYNFLTIIRYFCLKFMLKLLMIL